MRRVRNPADGILKVEAQRLLLVNFPEEFPPLRSKRIRARFHDIEMSMLEGVFSRGDRRLGKALLEARKLGCAFDAWNEGLKPEAWAEAFRAAGVDPEWYSHRERGATEVLPWAHIDGGASPDALAKERDLAREALADGGPGPASPGGGSDGG